MNCPHRPSTVGELTPNREQSSSLELPRCEGGRPTGQTNYFECTFTRSAHVTALVVLA